MIYELRQTRSKNKKHKYIYELIVDGSVRYTRKSNRDYYGATVEKVDDSYKCRFFRSIQIAQLSSHMGENIALTFDTLKSLK